VPYLDLPAIGWDQFSRSGRGYVQGRFRGEDFAYGEVEYRFPLQRKKETLGGVLFVNATSVSGREADINLFEYVNVGYGVGFRVMLDKRARTNFVIDYGLGQYGSNGFYVTLNETF
jgi:outer membrane protein assembly factor BamA